MGWGIKCIFDLWYLQPRMGLCPNKRGRPVFTYSSSIPGWDVEKEWFSSCVVSESYDLNNLGVFQWFIEHCKGNN